MASQIGPAPALQMCGFGRIGINCGDHYRRSAVEAIPGRFVLADAVNDAVDRIEMMQPIRSELPVPILDWVGPMAFPATQSMFDPLLPKGLQSYWKGAYVKEMPDRCRLLIGGSCLRKHLAWHTRIMSGLGSSRD